MNTYNLGERAVLMKISAGLPGKQRKDQGLTQKVKNDNALGQSSGRWIKQRFPDWALDPLEKVVTQARTYHAAVTLPFDNGIGILPAALVLEYRDKMREFKGRFDALVESHFRAKYPEIVDWAKREHNGTYNSEDYPSVDEVCEDFALVCEPLPLPESGHFSDTIKSLLGVDAQSVDIRIQDAQVEAQREVLRRVLAPVKHMAETLAKDKPRIYDTLIGNIRDICRLAPALNLAQDPGINALVQEVEKLTHYRIEDLRDNERTSTRRDAHAKAEAMVKRLEGYKI